MSAGDGWHVLLRSCFIADDTRLSASRFWNRTLDSGLRKSPKLLRFLWMKNMYLAEHEMA